MKFIYCRGGDKTAPKLAKVNNWHYGIRYDYTAYGDVYMLDGGLNPKWSHYMKRAKSLRPEFALVPDYYKSDVISLELYCMDVLAVGARVGVCPKFVGAVTEIPDYAVICESIPSEYAGFLIPDSEIIPNRDYHLLGGDPRLQLSEAQRITALGGNIITADGNKLMMKAAHGQVFNAKLGKWQKHNGTTPELAAISAQEVNSYLLG